MFSKKYNQAYVDKINAQTDAAHSRIEELEAEIQTHKNLEFELKTVKQLLNDDEAVLELLEGAKKKKEPATTEEIMLQQIARQDHIYGTNDLRSASALQAQADINRTRQLAGDSFLGIMKIEAAPPDLKTENTDLKAEIKSMSRHIDNLNEIIQYMLK